MGLHDYLARFTAMVGELQAHPKVCITHYWVGEPVSEEEIARVEKALGRPLDSAILELYRQANGLQLRWLDTGSPYYVADKHDQMVTVRTEALCSPYERVLGAVNLIPLEECFVTRDWSQRVSRDWMKRESRRVGEHSYWDFHQGIRPIDCFSHDEAAGFFIGGTSAPSLLIGGISGESCWPDNPAVDFEAYMECILRNRASVHRRSQIDIEDEEQTPFEWLLPRRRVYEYGTRVQFNGGNCDERATVIKVEFATTRPSGWYSHLRFIRVRSDRGIELYLDGSPTIPSDDEYERVFSDLPGFFERLLQQSPRQRFDTLAAFATSNTYTTAHRLEPRPGHTEPPTFSEYWLSFRFGSLSRQLDFVSAMDIWTTVIEDFLADEAGYAQAHPIPRHLFMDRSNQKDARYEQLIQLLISAMTRRMLQEYDKEPYDNLRQRLGEPLAERIGALADRLSTMRVNGGASKFKNTALLRQAVDALPATLPAEEESGYRGTRFGLDNLRLI